MWKDTFGSVSTCSRLDLELGGETSLETGGELSLETGGETAEGGVVVFVLPYCVGGWDGGVEVQGVIWDLQGVIWELDISAQFSPIPSSWG